ncbi:hypothetical protein [Novosphingobium sp. EMRT-2]|uniref:hypothetical protein n=1 Tax=Novosphingobium sp. EMRT-2 TaxID=2571749 RepID=UPI0010BDEFB9|nr:hypothetical protein [Novosphingobium sp. EMRT-2]QCI93360.1 hypothetical protein FA702_07205 [Novosphingobium sp. EMRT-2]
MINRDEIGLKEINQDVAREAFAQAERYLTDVIENKDRIDQRCFILLAGYLPVTLAVASGKPDLWGALAALLLTAGSVSLLLALRALPYPAVAVSPAAYMMEGIIDGDERALPIAQAALAHDAIEKIAIAVKSNRMKLRMLGFAIWCGALSIAALAAIRIYAAVS